MKWSRHSRLIEATHDSAKEFISGALRDTFFTVAPVDSMILSNSAVIFPSPSLIR